MMPEPRWVDGLVAVVKNGRHMGWYLPGNRIGSKKRDNKGSGPMKLLDTYICGMTWGWTGIRGTWRTAEAERSLREMADRLGVNWTAIAFAALQETAQSTKIGFREPPVVTDDEVRQAIRMAKSLGLRVCLKPVVNCKDGTWRAYISFFDEEVPGEPGWSDWFASYTEFMLHYARIAEETGCEMLCIGCEMVQSEKREEEWRKLIGQVRQVYSGLIAYNCDKYQEDRLTWWDAVDVITSSGYYPIGAWEAQLDRIEGVVRRYGKPFFFMEAGCPSRSGAGSAPNDWRQGSGPSEDEQAAFYEEMFNACAGREWVGGFMLWDWPAELYDRSEASGDRGYCIYGKKAEQIVAAHYRAITAAKR